MHVLTKRLYGVLGLIGPVVESLISVLASKKIFIFLCDLCHWDNGNMRNLPWLPTELGALGWPLFLCPQRLCTVVPALDHPLFPYVIPTAVPPGRNLHLSAMYIHRGCAFHPSPLPCASPCTPPQPTCPPGYRADFCPPRPQPAGAGGPSQGPAHVKSPVLLLMPMAAPMASLHQAQQVLLSKAQVHHNTLLQSHQQR